MSDIIYQTVSAQYRTVTDIEVDGRTKSTNGDTDWDSRSTHRVMLLKSVEVDDDVALLLSCTVL